jgi:hypothetical protein
METLGRSGFEYTIPEGAFKKERVLSVPYIMGHWGGVDFNVPHFEVSEGNEL